MTMEYSGGLWTVRGPGGEVLAVVRPDSAWGRYRLVPTEAGSGILAETSSGNRRRIVAEAMEAVLRI